jgi:excisionase family DNA binding protein
MYHVISKRVGRRDDDAPGTSLIRSTNAMLLLPSKAPNFSDKPGLPVDRGIVPSQKNMLELTQTVASGERLLSTPQVAQFLNVSRLTVYRLIERGVLPVHHIARRLRFSRADIAAYVASTRTHHQYGDTKD